jgi:hypothetical protein
MLLLKKQLLHLQNNFEANHNKDYSVVKTFRAGQHRKMSVSFFCVDGRVKMATLYFSRGVPERLSGGYALDLNQAHNSPRHQKSHRNVM